MGRMTQAWAMETPPLSQVEVGLRCWESTSVGCHDTFQGVILDYWLEDQSEDYGWYGKQDSGIAL